MRIIFFYLSAFFLVKTKIKSPMELRTSPAIVNDSVSILESLNFKPIPIPRTNTAIMIIPIPIFIFCFFELLKITVSYNRQLRD